MKSAVASAVLGAALLAQAASIGHGHAHVHRRAPTPAAEVKRNIQFISPADIARVQSLNIKPGTNAPCSSETAGAVSVGNDGTAPYVVEFHNGFHEDIVLVVWSDKLPSKISQFLSGPNGQQPDVTHTLQANTSTWISFDPSKAPNGLVKGGWSAIYSDTVMSYAGQISNTIGECTFDRTIFSTTDVSKLINMNGHGMTIENYLTQDDANNDSVQPLCTANMEKTVYVCNNGQTTCGTSGTYSLVGCTTGEPHTTCFAPPEGNPAGGCSGFTAEGGYMRVTFEE